MKNLKIYKASAGSGKTFRLTVEFIKTVLLKPVEYRHILAITFTNKATNEMKSRILEVLYNLSTGKPDGGYDAVLKDELSKNIDIRKQAGKVLNLMLNDFSYFNVSTIDSFFQKLLRSFIRELNLRFNFTVELNTDQTKEEIYNRLIQRMAENKMLRRWLTDMMHQKLGNDKGWNLKGDILATTSEVFKEFFQQQKDKISFSAEELTKVKKDFDFYEKEHLLKLAEHGNKFEKAILLTGLHYEDFYYGLKGVGGFFKKLSQVAKSKIIPELNIYSTKTLEEGKWFTKVPAGVSESDIELFHRILLAVIKDIDDFGAVLRGVIAVNKNFYKQGILTFIYDIFKEYAAENNLFYLPQAGLLIRKIIGDNPQPIIYEKIGNYFNQIMIDEFQDTSDLQYLNFKPLIAEIVSDEENSALVVGDVKQSIYRWRNANWNLLKETIKADFKDYFEENNLRHNFRSAAAVVSFNNLFFQFSATQRDAATDTTIFSEIYPTKQEDFQIDTKTHQGFVSLEGLSKEDFIDNVPEKTIAFIKELQDTGYRACDIALLVRRNVEASRLADILIAAQTENDAGGGHYNFKFISNEALQLISSPVVNLLTDILRYLGTPDNDLLLTQIKKSWAYLFGDTETPSPQKWLYDKNLENKITEKIEQCRQQQVIMSLFELSQFVVKTFGLNYLQDQMLFLKGVMDKIFEFETKNGNRLSEFIKWWDQNAGNFKVFFSPEQDAIQILTVHKSKGLQFPAVIMPFADWQIKNTDSLWVKSDLPPFNGNYFFVPAAAVRGSVFDDYARREELETLVDNLNILYVAFTRPETVLKVFYNTEAKRNFSSKWITEFVAAHGGNDIFEKGQLTAPPPQDNETTINSYRLKPDKPSSNYKENIFSRLAIDAMQGEEQIQGEIIHGILQHIKTKTDIDRVITQQNFAAPENSQIIRKFFDEGFKNKLFSDWFSDKWTVYNERDLVNTEGYIIRPDRLLVKDKTAVVIDFKTGEIHSQYHNQIIEYVGTVKQFGFETVSGYLVYLSPFKIEQVI
ncbi:MAG: UvrD-helicase domain-containing protein [Bacteroidales bacterium]|nr:UvrD-helicase domain-containing protein [Bacteroidales bacterium]